MKLGTLLLRNEVINLNQLETALRTQVLYGGRLGTNLVELGYIDVSTLAEYLAEILGVPLATQEMFDGVSEDVIADFGAALARRHEAFPLGFVADRPDVLSVALVNPGDRDVVAKLAEDLGSPVQPHVAPELRIYYYLERHYGIARKARFLRVGSAEPVPAHVAERRRAQPAGGIALPPRVRLEPRGKAAKRRPGTWGVPGAAPASVTAPDASSPVADETSARTSPPLSYRDACVAIDKAAHRDDIGDAFVAYARGRFEAAVVFLLRDGNALGWRMHSATPERVTRPIEELSLALGGTSALQAAHDSGKIYRGGSPSAGKPVERQLWATLGTEPEPEEVLVVPVTVKQRVVNLVYVHAVGGGPVDDTALKKMGELAQRASRAYLRLIQAAKYAVRTE